MKNTFFYASALVIASLVQTSCNPSAAEQKTTETKDKTESKDSVTTKIEPVKTSKTKEEIKSLTEELIHKKAKEITFDSGDYNGDKLLDYFVKTSTYGADDSQHNSYFFYDSKNDKITALKIKNGPKSIQNMAIKSIELGQIKSTATLQFEAGDIGTFNQKVHTTFILEKNQIVFIPSDLPNLKKADERLTKEVDAAYKELESGYETEEESEEM